MPPLEERRLLIIEDDLGLQKQLKWCFEEYSVVVAGSREAAITELRKHEPQVVTLDLGLPPDPANTSEGFATLQEILNIAPHTKVIVVTGNDDDSNAVMAIGFGAYDFCGKPIDTDMLGLIINRAFYLSRLESENRNYAAQNDLTPLDGIVAASDSMLKVCRTIEKVAPSDISSLLIGESGTGKELFAKAIHDLSARSNKPFVAINCAAIPENLLESELFGYEKGAFTGASKQTKGKIEYANGGTFFLDEIGDIPVSLQAKLLRFLQERVIERVGGRQEIPIDVRIVCATHQNLEKLIEEGRFREDLFYRISDVTIEIPSLRDRDGDAVLLSKVFLNKYNQQFSKSIKNLSQNALILINSNPWPGNVRQLESAIKRAVVMAENNQISEDDLGIVVDVKNDMPLNLKQAREKIEKSTIEQALAFTNDNISRASEMLGITRPTLYSIMKKYDMKEISSGTDE